MAKAARIFLNKNGTAKKMAVSVMNADETDLRVLCMLLLTSEDASELDTAELESLLEMDGTELNASIKYWRGANVICSAKGAAQNDGASLKTAYQTDGGALEKPIRRCAVEEYNNEELAECLEKRIGRDFIDEAQKAMGRIFNKNEVGKLVGIVEQLGFEQEAVLAILSYCVRIDKKSLSYAERIAVSFCEEEITTAEAVHAQIDLLERRNSSIGRIQSIFGFGGRRLSPNEKKYFITWTEEWCFELDVITRAYEITVDTIHEAVPKYTNSILKKWYENGLRTLSDVENFIEEEKRAAMNSPKRVSPRTSVQKNESNEKKNELEEWLDEKLRRTFGED